MARLTILYDVDGWAFHHRARALQKYAPPDFAVTIAAARSAPEPDALATLLGTPPPDIVLCLNGAVLVAVRELVATHRWPTMVVGAWSNGWPYHVARLPELYRAADLLVFNNRACWEAAGRRPDTCALPNGVDLDVFGLQRPIEGRVPKVLWTGSTSKRALKGYDDLIVPVERELRRRGVAFESWLVDSLGQGKRTPEEMARWYNDGTVLVCASAAEGTANPALEAAACGCTVVSTAVGNMPELIRDGENGYLVEPDVAALVRGIEAACASHVRLARAMQEDIQGWSWAARSRGYFEGFRALLANGGAARTARPRDLVDAVTVFVTTVGAPTFSACLEHLFRQDCAFHLRILEDVVPLSRALQKMGEACRTPFYVQVDEDMLLHPHAIGALHDGIVEGGPRVAVFGGNLYDAHLRRTIRGVKIFRHDVVQRYRVHRERDWIAALRERLTQDGYAMTFLPAGDGPEDSGTLGLHGTRFTPEGLFERYASLARRQRAGFPGTKWFTPYAQEVLTRFLEDPNEENYLALMGIVAGILTAADAATREKDVRTYGTQPGYRAARRLYEETRGRDAPP